MPRPKLAQCSRGHDVAVIGRYKSTRDGNGACKACNLIAAREAKKRRIEFLQSFKLMVGCGLCGYNKSARALDFHHTNPRSKLFSIAQRPYAPMKDILAEINKCAVICRNCHAEEHDSE